MKLEYKELKNRHREIRESLPESVRLRVHRALSWLKAANDTEAEDAKFIFLWIALNAVYAREIDQRQEHSEKGLFHEFLAQLIALDEEDLIYDLTWFNYSGKLRLFINNRYVCRDFWDFHNGRRSAEEWKRRFDGSCRAAANALSAKDPVVFMSILFDRLYVLRNQLVHGGATWNSEVNRDQVRDGSRILEDIVPVIIHLVLENPDEKWGAPCYPPID